MPEFTVTVGGREYDVDAPDPRTAYRWASRTHESAMETRGKREAADIERSRQQTDPLKEMGAGEKALVNVGAGMDAAWQGFKQIMPGMKGASDEEIREKREQDKRLAEGTQLGIGADWMPSAGSVAQFAGEVLPTMIPGGAAAKGLMATRMARTSPMLAQTLGGAAGGAGAAALTPTTSDESRALNMGIGGVAGTVLPLATKAYRAISGVASPHARAGGLMVEELGDDAAGMGQRVAARDAARAGRSQLSREIPESLAEATGSVPAANMEARSARSGVTNPQWADFKRGQNEARYAAVHNATEESGQIAAREAARGKATDPMREGALKLANKDQFFHLPVMNAALALAKSDAAVNPNVRRVADLVLSSMDERAPKALTPEGLYNVRKLLTEKLQGPAQLGDEISAAVKGADRETMQLIKAIDQSLDQASGGKWTRYLNSYKQRSRPVDQAKAAQLARDVFEAEGVPQLGAAPDVSATRLTRAIKASEGPARRTFPLTLSPAARGELGDVSENIARANEVQRARKLAGTAGGGSQTSTDLAQNTVGGVMPQMVKNIAGPLMRGGSERTQRELAALLQNPQAAVAAIQQAQALRRPLTEAETLLMQMISSGAGGLAGNTTNSAMGRGTALPLTMQQQQPMR